MLDWDADSAGLDLRAEGFEMVDMALYEMGHKLPFPLRPRVFAVLVVTAKTVAPNPNSSTAAVRAGDTAAEAEGEGEGEGLIVVQVPVDARGLAGARYTSGGNVGTEEGVEGKRCVRGRYVSVERARRDVAGQIEWVMGTASDAGGWLPMWVQRLGVPGAVIKDVGLFVGWVGGRRGGS